MLNATDSLLVNLSCTRQLSAWMENSFLLPSKKSCNSALNKRYKSLPDTITRRQAIEIRYIETLSYSLNRLSLTCHTLNLQSKTQLEQVTALRTDIISGHKDKLLQYLTFEQASADTIKALLDSLIKKSIDLTCKTRSIQ